VCKKKKVTKKLIIIVTSPSDVGIKNYVSQTTVTGLSVDVLQILWRSNCNDTSSNSSQKTFTQTWGNYGPVSGNAATKT